MNTKAIGIKQLAQNLSKILKEAQEKNVHFVVMRHGLPIAHVTPASHQTIDTDWDGIDLDSLRKDVSEARAQVKRSKVHTLEDIAKEFVIEL